MFELILILLGTPMVRRKWWIVGLTGFLWTALGLFFVVNAMIPEIRVSPVYFAIPLGIDGLFSLAGAFGSSDTARRLRLARAAVELALCVAIVVYPWHGGIVFGFLIGTVLVADAFWRASTAWLVRYAGWRRSCAFAALEFLFGVWSYVPWPTNWDGEVGADVGMLLIVSGLGVCSVALRLRRLMTPGDLVATVLARDWSDNARSHAGKQEAPPARWTGTVTVHVWTPTGALVPVRRGVSRYVAAFDEEGRVSTGHAALEAPGLYISHYPAVEIERDRAQFRKTVRAGDENDVPGLFQPSYAAERDDWCASTLQIRLDGLNEAALACFWDSYSRDTTYNLVDRNCSVAVARALDVGLDGIFSERPLAFLLRLLLVPELWVAGVMRDRAATMAWTPGLVLDYARALSHLVDPSHRRDGPR
ncbi:MAG: protease [Proteobacteria bacterium]|nr:protease [Pseudomonadota bacterium]